MTPTSTGNEAPPRRLGGALTITVGVALIVVSVAVLAVIALVRPGAQASEDVSPPPVPAEPPPEAVLADTGATVPVTADAVRTAIEDLLSAPELGSRVAASVVDLETGEELYAREPDAPMVPASTTKLVTAAAVLAAYGPAYQIPTTAVAGDEPGEVVLVGGGDPTLAIDDDSFYPGAARLDLLATQVRIALGETPVTRVTVDSSLFTGAVHGPWTSDIPGSGYVGPITALMTDGARVASDPAQGMQAAQRWDEPDLAAGEAFARLLGLGEDATVVREAAPDEPAVLGEVRSPPLHRVVEVMLSTSDNVVAEGLARLVAVATGQPVTFDGAGVAMAEVLADELGLAGDPDLADGSGLSRDNQLSARLLTDILVLAAGPEAERLGSIFPGLAVAGWSGTLLDRHEDPPAGTEAGLGVVRAKTGTLNGVDTLAGVVVADDGRPIGFALLADQVGADHTSARAALDRIPAALAGL